VFGASPCSRNFMKIFDPEKAFEEEMKSIDRVTEFGVGDMAPWEDGEITPVVKRINQGCSRFFASRGIPPVRSWTYMICEDALGTAEEISSANVRDHRCLPDGAAGAQEDSQ
jgi:hypothetical protein